MSRQTKMFCQTGRMVFQFGLGLFGYMLLAKSSLYLFQTWLGYGQHIAMRSVAGLVVSVVCITAYKTMSDCGWRPHIAYACYAEGVFFCLWGGAVTATHIFRHTSNAATGAALGALGIGLAFLLAGRLIDKHGRLAA